MRIAVISDSHNEMPATLLRLLAGADEIWHLGDVMDPRQLGELEQLAKPLMVVAGNCDLWPWPLTRRLTRGDYTFHLEHIPPPRPVPGVTAVLHGHTHIPRDDIDAFGVRWLNPGSVSDPRYDGPPSFAWLTLPPNAPYTWTLVPLR